MRQVAKSSNFLYEGGFTMISNIILDNQSELCITNEELAFLLKVYRHASGFKLHDSVLDPTISTRTLQRRRFSLKQKGLITYSIYKHQDEKGRFKTDGIVYDLTPLEDKLTEVLRLKESEKKDVILAMEENCISDIENSPLDKFCNDWFENYETNYRLTKEEKQLYNKLPEEEKKLVGHIFSYCIDEELLDSITPRLSLFFKTPFRWEALREYVSSIPTKEEELVDDIDGYNQDYVINTLTGSFNDRYFKNDWRYPESCLCIPYQKRIAASYILSTLDEITINNRVKLLREAFEEYRDYFPITREFVYTMLGSKGYLDDDDNKKIEEMENLYKLEKKAKRFKFTFIEDELDMFL